MEHQLEVSLRKIRRLYKQGKLNMQFTDQDFAFTKDSKTFGTDCVSEASFEPVSGIGDKALIVFVNACEGQFGLYDEDKETCLRIDIHEVVSTWVDEPAHFQRDKLTQLRDNLKSIIDRSE
jgi:hypothetical protein